MPGSELEQYKQYVSTRLRQIVHILEKYALGDFSENLEIPKKEDEFTELFVGLSLMMDEIKKLFNTEADRTTRFAVRAGKINEVIIKVAMGDYSSQVEISEQNDELDSISMGVNLMIDDIRNTVEEREREREIAVDSDKLWHASFNSLEDSILVINKDYTIERVNDSLLKLTGKREEEVIGKKCYQVIHGDKRPGEYCPFRKTCKSKKREEIERYEEKFGKYLSIKSSPVYDKNGEIVKFVDLIIDITERKRGEAELKNSEERFRTLFDYAPDAIYINDLKGTLTDGNKAAEKMLGYKKEELIGKNFLKLNILDKTQIPRVLKLLAQNILGKPTGPDEFILNRKDRGKVTVEILTYPVKIEGETRVLGIARDITERKMTEAALKEREELLNNITTSAQDGIVVIDNNGKVIFWNQAAEIIFGYDADEMKGKGFHETIAPERCRESYLKGYKEFRKSGTGAAVGKTLELVALNKKGKEFPVELSLSSMKIDGDWHGIGIIRNITQRKEIEKQLEKAMTRAEQANKAKSEFLANMSHEIRTPMNAILGFAEILEDKLATTPKYHDYVTGIRNSGKGLLGLINDILDLSKIEAGKLEINYEPMNPYTIIDEIRQIYSLKTKEKKLNFEINVDPDLPKGLLFDETRLRQILFNLIGNAIKFTNEGSVTVNVRSKDRYEEGSHIDLFIEVIDTGIGICEKSQQIIFEPFRQKDGQSTRRYGGTGLGLTITKRLVNLMNGTISLKSEVDKGSTFKIFLPHIQVSALVESTASEAEDVSGIEFKNPQILLVEDVESNRRVIRGYLESYNMRIIEAENGSIGIEKAKKYKPDLILMDMQMPGIDGYKATRILKEEKELKNIPIIALTASVMKRDGSKIENLCDGYLRKPVTKSRLLSELIKFLPYTKLEEPEEKGAKQEMDYIHELKQLALQKNRIPKELVDIFRTRIITEHENIMKNKSNKKIRNFASMVLKTGKEYNIKVLENYGMELEEYIDSFNVKNINALLSDFSEMAKIIS